MRRWRWVLLTLGAAMLSVGTAHAGVYNPGEWEEGATYPDFMNSPSRRDFHDVLKRLQSISVDKPPVDNPLLDNPLRRRYVFEEEMIKRVIARAPTTPLSIEDRLQASAVMIRRRKFQDAQAVLRPVAIQADELDNIPLQSNFATALHLSGDTRTAYDVLRPVVKTHWQKPWSELPEARQALYTKLGWSDAVYDLYREYDTYYLKLLRLRRLEKKPAILAPPDPLFDDGKNPPTPVKFLGANGQFDAGSIAAAEKAKLPPRALAIVQTLCVWLPDDQRLYWLLGELYNAQGNRAGILAAYQIFKELSEGEKQISKIAPVSDDVKDQLKQRFVALSQRKEQLERESAPDLNPVMNPVETGPGIDWRTVGVSFGTGVLLTLGAIWQVREIQRRRHVAQAKQQSRSA